MIFFLNPHTHATLYEKTMLFEFIKTLNFKWTVSNNEIEYINLFLTGVPSRISSKFFTNFASANIDVDGTLVDYVVKWYNNQELNQSITQKAYEILLDNLTFDKMGNKDFRFI